MKGKGKAVRSSRIEGTADKSHLESKQQCKKRESDKILDSGTESREQT